MYSHSLKWKSDGLKAREQYQVLNKARANFCPNSFVWTRDFPIAEHRAEMKELYAQKFKDSTSTQSSYTTQDSDGSTQHNILRKAMSLQPHSEKPSITPSHTAVLSLPSVFVPSYGAGLEEAAEWPCKEELDYEGDARVRTEKIHARMLPAPRVKGNDTVAWSLRSFVEPFPLDDFRGDFNEVSVFLRNHHVPELEFSHEDGIKILGSRMMDALDPIDKL